MVHGLCERHFHDKTSDSVHLPDNNSTTFLGAIFVEKMTILRKFYCLRKPKYYFGKGLPGSTEWILMKSLGSPCSHNIWMETIALQLRNIYGGTPL